MDTSGDDRLETALEDAFPGRDVDAVRATGPSWNERNRTVRVAFADGGTVFLKVATDGDGARIATERAAIAYVDARCDVAAPSVVASEPACRVPYLATAPMDGRDLAARWAAWDREERADAVRAIGAALAALHERSFDRHGEIAGGDGGDLVLESGAWTDVLVDRIALTRTLATTDRFDHHFDEVTAAVEANRDRLDDAPAALVHGDPARPNCFRSATAAGFVDWELAHVGDPARELHRARDQLVPDDAPGADRLAAALDEGYRDRAGSLPDGLETRRPVYDAVRLLGTSGFFDKWVEFADESPRAAANRVESRMDRYLERIR